MLVSWVGVTISTSRLVLFLIASLAGGVARAGDIESLQSRAVALDLAQSAHWHALMHYEPDRLGGGVTSAVVPDWFFLAGAGRTDPAAELAATLAAFFESAPVGPRDLPVRCAFPARFRFLERRLDIDRGRLPAVDCDAFERWRRALDARAVRLVFPSAYLNSPASMFGHTLLRIDGGESARGGELLSYAVNFAAETGDERGPVYAFKGLTGGYPGIYGVFPYYEKVRDYAWIENRDIWSYPLALSDAEIKRLVAHLWELDGVTFDYTFLSRNCAYQLLTLLEVARPSLRASERFGWYAIPADTIRALAATPDLLGEPAYRPALATVLRAEAARLDAPRRTLARSVAAGRAAPDGDAVAALPRETAARVLEVAHDLLYYRLQTGGAAAAARPRLEAILEARSRLGGRSGVSSPPPPGPGPHAGHPTARVAFGGVWTDDGFRLGARLRPGYHDLLDPPAGYPAGAGIELLDIGLRFDPDTGDARLADLVLLGIESLASRGDLIRPVSWRVSTGLRRRPSPAPFGDGRSRLGLYAEGGPGVAWGDFRSLAGYAFALGSADANRALDADHAVAAGGSIGLLARPAAGWHLRAEVGGLSPVAGDDSRRRWAELHQQWDLPSAGGIGLGLRLTVGWRDERGRDAAHAALGLQTYF
ncbi:DUF4105 domain-containing protein [Salinisphaera sp. PC39]|uniref:DUF4105 domain-containing protein n=1 Tax=Salinisphaera sp. PC39 TaxID=1304156 RepID=UPI00333FBA52